MARKPKNRFAEVRAAQCTRCGELFEDACQAEGCSDKKCPARKLLKEGS